MASSENAGGMFLSTLKEKNEKQRTAKMQSKASALTVTVEQQRRKSFMGSFFFGTSTSGKKRSSMASDGVQQAMREASSGVEKDETETDRPRKQDSLETKTHSAASTTIQSDDQAVILEQTTVYESEGTLVEHLGRDGASVVDQQQQSDVHVHVIRGVASMGILESGTEGAVVPRQRRASTTVESSPSRSRVSSSAGGGEGPQHRDSHVRDRTPSTVNVNEVYGRAGRDPRMFEMTNPLLDDSNGRNQGRSRALSSTPSTADLELDSRKRASLYQSASHHVDQTLLLERRNTRAGRSPSMDGGSSAPQSNRRSMVEMGDPVAATEGT